MVAKINLKGVIKMENQEDKKLAEDLKNYLETEGVSIYDFCKQTPLPDGGFLTPSTLYRKFDGTTLNFSEKIRFAIRNNPGFKKYMELEETAVTEEMERQYAIKVLNVINDIKQGERAKVLRRAITMNSI